jgi:hypothetical protein
MVTAKGHGLTAQSVGRRNLPKTVRCDVEPAWKECEGRPGELRATTKKITHEQQTRRRLSS